MPLGSRLPTSEGGDTRLGCRHPTRMSPPDSDVATPTSEGGNIRGWRLLTRMSPPKKKESKTDQRWQHPRVATSDIWARVATSYSDVATKKERKQIRSEVATSEGGNIRLPSAGGYFRLGCCHQQRKKARQIRGGNIRLVGRHLNNFFFRHCWCPENGCNSAIFDANLDVSIDLKSRQM